MGTQGYPCGVPVGVPTRVPVHRLLCMIIINHFLRFFLAASAASLRSFFLFFSILRSLRSMLRPFPNCADLTYSPQMMNPKQRCRGIIMQTFCHDVCGRRTLTFGVLFGVRKRRQGPVLNVVSVNCVDLIYVKPQREVTPGKRFH